MKIKFWYESWVFKLPILNAFAGMVLYPWIFFKGSKEEVSDRLFRHELEHIYQVRREGWLKFHVKYFYFSIRKGYRNNPYEIEATTMSNIPLTAEERALKG